MDLTGTFLMEVLFNVLGLPTTELGLFIIIFMVMVLMVVGQYVSTVTLRVPQQESSAVTYLMPVETYRASMWGYTLPSQVSPAATLKRNKCISTEECFKTYIKYKLSSKRFTLHLVLM